MTGIFGGKIIFTESRDEWYERFTGATARFEVLGPAKTNKMSIGGNAPNALFYKALAERGDVKTWKFQVQHGCIGEIFQQAAVVLRLSYSGRIYSQ